MWRNWRFGDIHPRSGSTFNIPLNKRRSLHLLQLSHLKIASIFKMASIKPSATVTYKTVGSLQIPMDIYLPPNPNKAPILLWFHGGGLLYASTHITAQQVY